MMKKFVLGALMFVGFGLGILFAQNVLPDEAEISVKDSIVLGEATNLGISLLRNGTKMTSYDGTILMQVTDENGNRLKDNECVLPSLGMYTFLPSDLGEKEFQRGLEIKKEGTFYIEVSDLNDSDEKILGKKLVQVVRQGGPDGLKHIEIVYPNSNGVLIGGKVEVLASCPDIPNSEAIVYIDDKPVGTTRVGSDGSILYTIGSIEEGQHSLFIEIPDVAGNVMGNSEKIFFTSSSVGTSGIKNVFVDPERGLMVGDMVNVVVYTDDMVESVKMKLSDRTENDSMVMNKVSIGEFSQNVWLIGSGEISLSFNLSSANNLVNESFDNYKTISVSDVPNILDVKVDTNSEEKSAKVSWDVSNKSAVLSYLIDWWVEGETTSGKDWSETTSFVFNDVPYDTTVNLSITPYRANASKHGAASKTIQFVISKNQEPESCGNGICDNGENNEKCPQDCNIACGNLVCENGESYETCPKDCAGSGKLYTCFPQSISTRTKKVGDNYYLIRDKAENITKYVVYSSTSPDGKDKVKVYETTDTSYEYPFDHTSEEDVFMYFRVIGICENGEELELTGATKVQVGPAENFFLLMCLTFLIYFGIKIFRQTED